MYLLVIVKDAYISTRFYCKESMKKSILFVQYTQQKWILECLTLIGIKMIKSNLTGWFWLSDNIKIQL